MSRFGNLCCGFTSEVASEGGKGAQYIGELPLSQSASFGPKLTPSVRPHHRVAQH